MLRRLLHDESGMTMALAVITMVLIGVMGAGLLAFVHRDLESVVEENRGQRAFEMAEAGVQLAKEQLQEDSIPGHYDGGSSADIRWSKFYSGSAGMTFTNLDNSAATSDSVNVQIEYRLDTTDLIDSFVVVSTGNYGDARRKIEAVFKRTGAIRGIPPAYYTRSSIVISGNTTSTGVSFFARNNGNVSGSIDFGSTTDSLGKWAETSDSFSFPNPFNETARPTGLSALPGVAVGNVLTLGAGSNVVEHVQKGVRSFDKDTAVHVVPYYRQSTRPANEKIAFPFSIDSLPNDLEILREEAIAQEAASGGTVDHYVDNLPVGTHFISSYPTGTDFGSVFFYRFPTYSNTNRVIWNVDLPCSDSSRRGVIVVENADFEIAGNHGGFNGTVLVYGGNNPATGLPYPDQGNFHSAGTSCITGYATSTGDMFLSGNYHASNIPGLTQIPIFRGTMEPASWRELYQ